MKSKKLLIAILVLLLASTAYAPYPITYRNVGNPRLLTRLLQDRIGTLDDQVSDLEALSGGVYDNIGTGDIFYVDSGVAADLAGTTWATAFDTLQDGIDECAANNGDIVYVAQGHAEDITNASLLNADNAGITIVGIGNGADMPEISFITDATAEMTISAADVCIYNIRFLGARSGGVTAGIIIADAGDGAMILGCEFRETDSDNELLTMINAAANADELVIVGNRFIGESGGTDSSAIYLVGGSDKTIIQGNHFIGDWSASVIDGLQAQSTEMVIADNLIMNADNGAGGGKTIQVQATSTGVISGNKCYGNNTGFAIAGAAMFVAPDNIAIQTEVVTRTFEQMIGPFTGATGGLVGTTIYADMVLAQTDLDAILTDGDRWDTSGEAQTLLFGSSTPGATAAALTTVDTVVDSILVDTASLIATIANMIDNGYAASCEVNAGAGTVTCATLGGFGDNYFNTGWSLMCILDADGAGSAPEGEVRDITAYVSGTGVFTVSDNFTSVLTTGDGIMLLRVEEQNLDDPAILGSSGDILYVDASAVGDGSGLTMENAYASLTLALDGAVESTDTIIVSSGHAETVSAAYAINDIGVRIVGLGIGTLRPTLTFDTSKANANLDVSVANVTFENLVFTADLDDLVSCFDVADGGDGLVIKDCLFTSTATTKEFLSCIELATDADDCTIENCTFLQLGTDADQAIDITTGAVDNLRVINCKFYGDYDAGCIYSDQDITNAYIADNVMHQEATGIRALDVGDSATGTIVNNMMYSDTYATILDPGTMICINNWATDAADQQAIQIPISADTPDVGAVGDGSNLERLEFLQDRSDSILAAMQVAGIGIGNVYYLDSVGGNASYDSLSWDKAEATLAGALGDITTDTGSILFVAPNHAETTIGASIAINKANVTIIGLGEGASRPTFTFTATGSVFTVSVAEVVFKNLIFVSGTADSTVGITLASGADSTVIEDCEFLSSTEFEFLSCITFAVNTDDVRISRCKFNNSTAAATDATAAITNIANVTDGMTIEDCEFYGIWSVACINSDDADTDVMVRNNTCYNTETAGHAIEFSDAALGFLINNKCYAPTWGTCIDPGSLQCFGNYVSSEINSDGMLFPTRPQKINSIHGTGRIIYVDVGVTAGGGGTWETAFDSINDAMDDTSASRGDTIYVAPGHTETVTGATGAVMDVIGVNLIGLGTGALRPTITFTTAIGATISVTAADCTIENMILVSNWETGITAAITAGASADGLTVDNVEFRDSGNTKEMFAHISLAAACDDVTIKNCYFSNTAASAETLSAILFVAAVDNCQILNNRFHMDAETASILGSAGAGTNVYIADNTFFNIDSGGLALSLNAATTGIVVRNLAFGNVATTSPYTCVGCMVAENYGSGTEGSSGIIYPAVE